MTCIHLYNLIQNSFTVLKTLGVSSIHPSLPPTPGKHRYFTVSIVLPFPDAVRIIHSIVLIFYAVPRQQWFGQLEIPPEFFFLTIFFFPLFVLPSAILNLFIFFIYGCVGSSFLCKDFL